VIAVREAEPHQKAVEFDVETGRFEAEVEWHDSYEAAQDVHYYGTSSLPVAGR